MEVRCADEASQNERGGTRIAEPKAAWAEKSLDGFWTYVVPGTSRGGVLVIRSGVVAGGNSFLSLRGVVLPINDKRIFMTTQAMRFNRDPRWNEDWPANADFFSMTFNGEREGDNFVGTVTRQGIDDNGFEVILTRRGPAL